MLARCNGEARSLLSPFCVKAMLLGPMLVINIVAHANWIALEMARELSHVSMWLTTLQLAISLLCSLNPEIERNRSCLLGVHHTLYELTLAANLVIPAVYWTILREDVLSKLSNTPVLRL